MKGILAKNLPNDNNDEGTEMKNSNDLDRLMFAINEINRKLAENGTVDDKFEELMFKFGRIEDSQEKILEQISELHEAVYDPDDGLFARIKNVEKIGSEEVMTLDKELYELKSWRENEKKNLNEIKISVDRNAETLKQLETKVEELKSWKSSVSGTLRWIFVTMTTTTLGILSKLLYDFLSGHIKIS